MEYYDFEEKEYEGDLIIIRGLPGAGKTTFAELLGGTHLEVDHYFINSHTGEYEYDTEKLAQYNIQCRVDCEKSMLKGHKRIVVSNPFIYEWEVEYYVNLAKKLNYRVFSIVMESRHDGELSYDVPEDVLEKMYTRFAVQL